MYENNNYFDPVDNSASSGVVSSEDLHGVCDKNMCLEGEGILMTKDGQPLDWSNATLSQVTNLISKGSFCIQRVQTSKYHYYSDVDSFPPFYDQEFDSIQEVEFELRKHAQQHGFDIRLSNVDKDPQGIVRMRRFVCSCEGKKRSSMNNGLQSEFSWTSPQQSRPSALSASSLLASIIMNKKNSRCGCPYFVVYKRRPSEVDPNKYVYKAHSLDTFHNHLREGDRIVRGAERLSNSNSASTERVSEPSSFGTADSFHQTTDFKMLYELLSDANSDKGLHYILQCIHKLAQISPDHYRHINMDMKKYLRDITLSIASVAADSLGGHDNTINDHLSIPPTLEMIFNKDNVNTHNAILNSLPSDGSLPIFHHHGLMESDEMNVGHGHDNQRREQSNHKKGNFSTHSSTSNVGSSLNSNSVHMANTMNSRPQQAQNVSYQIYNSEGSIYPNPFFTSVIPGASLPSMESSSMYSSNHNNANEPNGSRHNAVNDLESSLSHQQLPLHIQQQHATTSSMFGMLPEVFAWFNSSDGRYRREDSEGLREGLDHALSDEAEHDIFQVFNNTASSNIPLSQSTYDGRNNDLQIDESNTVPPSHANTSSKRTKR